MGGGGSIDFSSKVCYNNKILQEKGVPFMRWHRETENRRFSCDRVKKYPEIRAAFEKLFCEIVVLLPMLPARFGKTEPGRRTDDEEKLVKAYKDIVCLMRKLYGGKKHHRHSTDWNFWRLAYRDAFILANELDNDYTLWRRLSWEEQEFFRAFTKIIGVAKEQAKAKYDSNFGFTADEFGHILRHMERGEKTPFCAR